MLFHRLPDCCTPVAPAALLPRFLALQPYFGGGVVVEQTPGADVLSDHRQVCWLVSSFARAEAPRPAWRRNCRAKRGRAAAYDLGLDQQQGLVMSARRLHEALQPATEGWFLLAHTDPAERIIIHSRRPAI